MDVGRIVCKNILVSGDAFLIDLTMVSIFFFIVFLEGVLGSLFHKSFMPISKKTAFGLKNLISPILPIIPSVVSPPIPLFTALEIFSLFPQSLPPSVILFPRKTT